MTGAKLLPTTTRNGTLCAISRLHIRKHFVTTREGINWRWFFFTSPTAASSFLCYLDAWGQEHRGVAKFFNGAKWAVRVRS